MIAQEVQNNSQSTIGPEDPTNLKSMIGPKLLANSWSTIDRQHQVNLWLMTGVKVQINSLSKTQQNSFKLMREQVVPANLWSMIGQWVLMPLTSLAKEGQLELKTLLLLSVTMWETRKNTTKNSCKVFME
jgi:hypothetical protein